jgi:hypothetical protein
VIEKEIDISRMERSLMEQKVPNGFISNMVG